MLWNLSLIQPHKISFILLDMELPTYLLTKYIHLVRDLLAARYRMKQNIQENLLR